jgi:hypothetical protein
MIELFVPYDLALLAKEKGFNYKVIATFNADKTIRLFDYQIERSSALIAPMFQQIVDWLRTKHELYITQEPHKDGQYSFYCQTENGMIETYGEYYEALNEMLTDILKITIK